MTHRREAAQSTRKKLLEAARKIVRERGLAGTQVEEITQACGVAKGTFYTYFKRKEDVISALCWVKFEELRDEALSAQTPFAERLAAYLTNFCAYIEAESLKLCQEWIRNTADPDLAGNRDGMDKLDFDIAAVSALISDGIKRGEVKPDAPVGVLAHTLVAVMYGEMLCWAVSNGGIPYSGRTREFCSTFLEPLLKPYLNDNHGEVTG
ncbi:MAG: TetR/AcrR family transcriptional regulator, partial [Lentisphaeria bacterium]|nr:TetR/AcrR family transcriptional regulator [Lentisphaeria bacterium]